MASPTVCFTSSPAMATRQPPNSTSNQNWKLEWSNSRLLYTSWSKAIHSIKIQIRIASNASSMKPHHNEYSQELLWDLEIEIWSSFETWPWYAKRMFEFQVLSVQILNIVRQDSRCQNGGQLITSGGCSRAFAAIFEQFSALTTVAILQRRHTCETLWSCGGNKERWDENSILSGTVAGFEQVESECKFD